MDSNHRADALEAWRLPVIYNDPQNWSVRRVLTPRPRRWQRRVLPLNYSRMDCPKGVEPFRIRFAGDAIAALARTVIELGAGVRFERTAFGL